MGCWKRWRPMMSVGAVGAVVVLLAPSVAFSQDTSPRRYNLPEHGLLELRVPTGWTDRVGQPADRLPPTIGFGPKSGRSFKILLTPLWQLEGRKTPFTLRDVRKLVQSAADHVREGAVEKNIELKSLEGPGAHGYYFSATDSAPRPGEFKYLTQGTLTLGDIELIFSVLTNEGQNEIVKQALQMLGTGVHERTPAGTTD
jgi:hypothetical protein